MKELKTNVKKPDKPRAIAWLDSALDSIEDNTEYEITLKKKAKHRSLNANAYAWVLINKLSEANGLPPEFVYREQLKAMGGHSEVVTVGQAAADKVITLWKLNGLGWTAEPIGEHDGEVDLLLSYGSSVFETWQMAQLIDNLVQDCRQIGIETMSPAELDSIIAAWGDNHA